MWNCITIQWVKCDKNYFCKEKNLFVFITLQKIYLFVDL
jgi:hypothetical protein